MKRKVLSVICLTMAISTVLAGCGGKSKTESMPTPTPIPTPAVQTQLENVTELAVRFGDEGEPYTLHLDDNVTTAALVTALGGSSIRLPIYHFDDYENWEVMQYYDIPSKYEIPSEPETVTEQYGGEVYFDADLNRVILFYNDANIQGEYTRIGCFDYSDEFVSAVENNPVLEGWGNKIINISLTE